MGLFRKASCHRSPPHEPTTAPPIPCVPSSPGKLHNTAHATRRRRAPPSSFFDAHETFPHQSRPSILNAPAKTFSTRHTEHVTPRLPRSLAVSAGPPSRTRLQPRPLCHRQAGPPPLTPTRFTPNPRQEGPPPGGPRASHRNHKHRSPSPSPFLPARQKGRNSAPPLRAHHPTAARRFFSGDEPPPAARRRRELRSARRPLVRETLPNSSDRVVVAVFR